MTAPARLAVVALAALVASGPVSAQRSGLTAAPALARVYDAIFDAQFDDVPTLLVRLCGPLVSPPSASVARSGLAPREACRVLELVSLWWQIQLDPMNPARDAEFESRANATVAAVQSWTTREPDRAESWFYLGGALGARVQWRVLRGERLAAARDGARIKSALERALTLDRQLEDAFFGIGLYHYYADVAPATAKMLRWLLFLPGGNKEEGLREMLRARSHAQVLRSEADYQLHVLYLWYEQEPERALDLLRALRDRHPSNPLFLQLIAEIEDVYLHDAHESLRTWQALLDAAQASRVAEPAATAARARLGLALQADRLHESDRAIVHLRATIEARPPGPFGVVAQAELQLGQALDRLGSRTEALAAYRAAILAAPKGDPLESASRARIGLRQAPDMTTALAFRLSLEGWRAVERGELEQADRALAQSLALRPADVMTRYRLAQLRAAQKDEGAALEALEAIVTAGTSDPPSLYASACVDAAAVYEGKGQRERAIELYRVASAAFGADRRTRESARRALARLNASAAIHPRHPRAHNARDVDARLLESRPRTET